MRKIYVDAENHCHVVDGGNMVEVETDFFDGMCDAVVEGYCYEIEGNAVYPWKPYGQLMAKQREYERQLIEAYQTELSDLRENSVSIADLEAAYEEGVNSV